MFLKNFVITIYFKLFWIGLILGLFKMFCNFICKLCKHNFYIENLIGFCFWSLFSLIFIYFCIYFNNFEFSIFGFLILIAGIKFIQISIEFCFTKLLKLLYNKIDKINLRKINNGKLKSSEKV